MANNRRTQAVRKSDASEFEFGPDDSGTCAYSFDPSRETDAQLQTSWECPHPAPDGADHCIFHMSQDTRRTHGVTPDDVVAQIEANLRADDPRSNEYIGADIPYLSLTYQDIDGDTNHALNFQYADIDGIDLTHATFDQGLNLREARIGQLKFKDATYTGVLEANQARIDDEFTAYESEFHGDVHFSGAEFRGDVTCDEAVFDGDTSFADATFHGAANFRNMQTQGTSHELNDHISFESAEFRNTANFRQTTFEFSMFRDAEFRAGADFAHCVFDGNTEFDGAVFHADADFDETTFDGDVTFAGATFKQFAEFRGAEFNGGSRVTRHDCTFEGATFEDSAGFKLVRFRYVNMQDATFEGDVNLDRVTVAARADCHSITFGGAVDLERATFDGRANFNRATVNDRIGMESAEFRGTVAFTDADISGTVDMAGVRCSGDMDCDGITIDGAADFESADFGRQAAFSDATFGGRVRMESAEYRGDATFAGAEVHGPAEFDEVRFREDVDFGDATFHDTALFRGADFEGNANHVRESSSFESAEFHATVNFESATFTSASFVDTRVHATCNLRRVTFRESARIRIEAGGNSETYVDCTDAYLGGGRVTEPAGGIVPFDLTRATLGDVRLEAESNHHELLDYFRFCLTDFDGFDWTNHHAYLERNDWELHRFVGDHAPDVELTNNRIEETYRRAQEAANSIGDTPAKRGFEFQRWYYNRQKNRDMVLNEYSLNGLTRAKKVASIGLNFFFQYTCGYANRVPRIILSMFAFTAAYAVLFSLGGPFETQAGVVWTAADPARVLFDAFYYSGISFTTIGYGDIGPIGWAAKLLAASEGYVSAIMFTLLTVTLLRSAIGSS